MSSRTISIERMHKLRVFACIVEQGSMTRAAHALELSRSVVSGHLKQLERDLGVRLIDRTTRSMRVLPVGEQVYAQARRMVEAGQSALDVVEAHLGAVRGLLRVAVPLNLAPTVLAPVVEALREAHPELQIAALVGDRPVDLVREAVDVAVRIGIPQDSGLVMRRLGRTEELFVASPDLLGSRDPGLMSHLTALPRLAHALVDDARPTLRHPDGSTRVVALQPPVVSVASSDLVRRFAVNGLGTAVLPELFIREELAQGALVRLVDPWIRRPVEVYVLTPARSASPAAHAFIEAVRRQLDPFHGDRT